MSQSSADSDDSGLSRRTLIRLLIGLGIGIPILVEGLTLLGLVEQALLGDDEDEADEGTATPSAVHVGDEILPETPQREVLSAATIRAAEDGWRFTVTVEVDNDAEVPYELRLGTVTTSAGTEVRGGGSTGRIAPGDSGTAAAFWLLPEGETPATVEATAITTPEGESPETTRSVIELGQIPVQGS